MAASSHFLLVEYPESERETHFDLIHTQLSALSIIVHTAILSLTHLGTGLSL